MPNWDVKQVIDDDLKHRYEMIPDVEGKMHLVDLNAYNMSIARLFDAEKEMKFMLTTRTASAEEITFNVESLAASSFNRNHPTRFTIHGWNGDLTSSVNSRIAEEYLKFGNFNCITIDWSRGAGELSLKSSFYHRSFYNFPIGTLDYIAARYRIDDVAKFSAKFIDFLHEHGYLEFKQLHLIGHSLG